MTRLFRGSARGWLGTWSSRSVLALSLGALLVLALIRVAIAQSSRRAPSDLQQATRALVEGRFDDVASLTQKLNSQDPAVVTLTARALIARGRYAEAESALRPAAERAPTSDAALELGLLAHMLGRADAQALLGRVAGTVTTTNDPYQLARGARALRALGRSQEANAAYRDAASSLTRDPAVQTAWGELFLEKYNRAEALKSFKSALTIDPSYAPALVGVARSLAEDNPPQGISAAHAALKINPSYVDALVFLAGGALDAGKRDEAKELLKKALDVNPSSLDARALVAAVAYVEDRPAEFEDEVKRALAVAPTRGEVFRVAGDLAARNYRFDEAVVLTKRALGLEPQNARAQADLGLHLLRTGDEPGARAALEVAARYDRLFANIRTDFNARFMSSEGIYREKDTDPFAQTAQILPLAFGLVPDAQRAGRTVGGDAGCLQHPVLGGEERRRQGQVGEARGVNGLERGLVRGQHIEAGHDDVEQRIAPLLSVRALGRPLEHLVVDAAQQRRDDGVLGVELTPEVGKLQLCSLGDIEQRHVGPALGQRG